MEPLCLAVAALSALFALLLTPVARHVARRAGFIDRPGGRKIHREPTPYGGGVALAAAMLLALAAGAFLYRKLLYDPAWNGWYFKLGLDQYVREVRMSHREPLSPLLWKILAGAGGALIFGLADDRWAFRPLTKLAVQFVLAAAVVAGACGSRPWSATTWPCRRSPCSGSSSSPTASTCWTTWTGSARAPFR
ncbi:MAG: hypothetical protein M5U26_18475 [Planctomycetota bacterium]|nr:hypothetical protein [Planctomycetota bacterium]